MTILNRIFLDVDDVLVDFTIATLKFLGCLEGDDGLEVYDPTWKFDIVKAANILSTESNGFFHWPYTQKAFWKGIPRNLWATLPKLEECDYLIQLASEIAGEENVILLTSPINDPECAAGKMELIRDHFGFFWENRQYMIGPPKWSCASENALLIDDSDKNIDAFRAAGGIGILFPRPWNSAHHNTDQAFDHVCASIEEQITEQREYFRICKITNRLIDKWTGSEN
jgi:hypothetical protein